MRFSATTAIAQGPRPYQEDRLHTADHRVLVCDGMGGHVKGDLAAETAIGLLASADFSDAMSFEQAIMAAGEAVLSLGDGHYDDPGTTMVGAALLDGVLVVGWCGDSRLYVVRDDRVRYATQDHSGPFGGLERCLGADTPTEPDMELIDDARPGDRVVVVSDGVMAALHDTEDQVVKATSAEELLDACSARGLRDNTAIIVANIVEG